MNRIRILLVVLSLLLFGTLKSQTKYNTYADSVNVLYHQYLDSNNYPKAYENIRFEAAYYLEHNNILKSRMQMDSAFSLLPPDADTLNHYYSLCLEIRAMSYAFLGDPNMLVQFERFANHLLLYDSDSSSLARAYGNIALVYFNRQDQDYTGIEYINKATRINNKLQNWEGLINNYMTFCSYLSNTEYNDLANKYLNYCEYIYHKYKLNNVELLARIYKSQGVNFTHQGKYDKSFTMVKKAYKLLVDSNIASFDVSNYAGNVALDAIDLKEYSEAKKYAILSINYAKEYYPPSSVTMANYYLVLGQSLVKLNELDSADYYLDKCIDIYLNNYGINYFYLSIPYHGKAEVLEMKERPLEAAYYFQKSIYTSLKMMDDIDTSLLHIPSITLINSGIDIIKFAISRKSKLLYKYSESTNDNKFDNTIINHLAKLDSIDWQYTNKVSLSMDDNTKQFNEFKGTLDLMAKMYIRKPKIEYLGMYENMLNNQKAGYLDAAISMNNNVLEENNNPKLRSLNINISNSERDYNTYDGSSAEYKAQMLDTLCTLYAKKLELTYKENSSNIKDTSVYKMSNLSISTIQKYAIKKNAVVVDYFYYENNLYTLAISGDQAFLKQIDIGDSFTDKISSYNKALKTQSSSRFAIANELSDLLIKPILSRFSDVSSFVIIPFGKLSEIPFDLLPINKDGKMLIQKYAVSYHYSTKLWVKSMNKELNKEPSLLALAPIFDKKSKISINDYNEIAMDEVENENIVSRSGELKPLPYSKNEVIKIANLFDAKSLNKDVFLYDKATVKNFMANIKDKSIIHIATHGISSKRSIYKTGLFFFSNKKEKGDFLSVPDLFHVDLTADLVVLSACKTASGQIVDGEGAIALPRAFFQSGVANILSSFWKINDKKAQNLMVLFYGYLLEGNDYAVGLQKAKLDFINKGYSDLDWAGFMLIGR